MKVDISHGISFHPIVTIYTPERVNCFGVKHSKLIVDISDNIEYIMSLSSVLSFPKGETPYGICSLLSIIYGKEENTKGS